MVLHWTNLIKFSFIMNYLHENGHVRDNKPTATKPHYIKKWTMRKPSKHRAGFSWPQNNKMHRYSKIVALIYYGNIKLNWKWKQYRHTEARNSRFGTGTKKMWFGYSTLEWLQPSPFLNLATVEEVYTLKPTYKSVKKRTESLVKTEINWLYIYKCINKGLLAVNWHASSRPVWSNILIKLGYSRDLCRL